MQLCELGFEEDAEGVASPEVADCKAVPGHVFDFDPLVVLYFYFVGVVWL